MYQGWWNGVLDQRKKFLPSSSLLPLQLMHFVMFLKVSCTCTWFTYSTEILSLSLIHTHTHTHNTQHNTHTSLFLSLSFALSPSPSSNTTFTPSPTVPPPPPLSALLSSFSFYPYTHTFWTFFTFALAFALALTTCEFICRANLSQEEWRVGRMEKVKNESSAHSWSHPLRGEDHWHWQPACSVKNEQPKASRQWQPLHLLLHLLTLLLLLFLSSSVNIELWVFGVWCLVWMHLFFVFSHVNFHSHMCLSVFYVLL